MAAMTTFAGFQPPIPARRKFDLYRMFAQYNRDTDTSLDLLRFSNILNEVAAWLLADIDSWVDIFDIDRALEGFIDAILADLGNPFAFDLTLIQKRKLAKVLVRIYKLKGTEPGIVTTLRFFLGVESDLIEFNDEDTWVLGDDELGVETFLGTGDQASLYSFDVEVDRELADEERRLLREIVDYMKPGHTHHIRTIEP